MRWTQFFVPTVKETPADAVVPSHQLALRAGLIRQVAAGSYTYLPLGYRVLRKIEQIVREEMNAAGAIELHMPAMQPLAWWEETGRAAVMGDVLVRVKGGGWQTGVVLGPTHEEVVTETVKAYVNSYKQLPVNLYQIQTKFRGEERPKSGVLRTREFLMKDAYSFDADLEGLDQSYRRMFDAYCRLFARCGLPYRAVEAESGPIGGDASHEFMVETDAGEDLIAISDAGDYAANLERADYHTEENAPSSAPPDAEALEEIHTPNCPGIDSVCDLLGITPDRMIKTLVYAVMESDKRVGYLVACVRGDHEVNENKLRRCLAEGQSLEMAETEGAIADGFAIGYVGPHVLNGGVAKAKNVKLIIDWDAAAVQDAVTGNNAKDHHCKHFYFTRDVEAEVLGQATYAKIRNAVEGDTSPSGKGALQFRKTIEIGHVFKLGTKYSDALGATYLDVNGKAKPFIMGCYGIGLNRILAAAIESSHDDGGIIWPISIAPFEVEIVALDVRDDEVMRLAGELHDGLVGRGVDVLLDDRDQRPGFKFKDADLIGIPWRITVGKRGLADGIVEVKQRRGGEVEKIAPTEVLEQIVSRVESERQGLSDTPS